MPHPTKYSALPRVRYDADDKPYTENYPPLHTWLDDVSARCMWQVPGPQGAKYSYVEAWNINGHCVIIQVFGQKRGWQIWTSNSSNRILDTFEDVEQRCGLGPELKWDDDHSRELGRIVIGDHGELWLVVGVAQDDLGNVQGGLLARMRTDESAKECVERCALAIREAARISGRRVELPNEVLELGLPKVTT